MWPGLVGIHNHHHLSLRYLEKYKVILESRSHSDDDLLQENRRGVVRVGCLETIFFKSKTKKCKKPIQVIRKRKLTRKAR